jgi:hypothetical protein
MTTILVISVNKMTTILVISVNKMTTILVISVNKMTTILVISVNKMTTILVIQDCCHFINTYHQDCCHFINTYHQDCCHFINTCHVVLLSKLWKKQIVGHINLFLDLLYLYQNVITWNFPSFPIVSAEALILSTKSHSINGLLLAGCLIWPAITHSMWDLTFSANKY